MASFKVILSAFRTVASWEGRKWEGGRWGGWFIVNTIVNICAHTYVHRCACIHIHAHTHMHTYVDIYIGCCMF